MPDGLRDWIGSREDSEDLVTAWPARALHATLDLPGPVPGDGDPVPPLWHWLYFLPTVPHSGLGPEGHARLGGFLPPVPLPRRMFAGGRVTFHRPLRIGRPAHRIGTVERVEEKQGKTGRLIFVGVRFQVGDEGGPCLTEEQDLVYLEGSHRPQAPQPGTEPIPPGAWIRTVAPDPVMLFRFSALTFNSHRIHYDHPYVTRVEGYPGLVVHGPLTALLLADHAARNGPGRLQSFSFRGRSPLFTDGPFTLLGDPAAGHRASLSVWSHDGRLAATAEAEFTPAD